MTSARNESAPQTIYVAEWVTDVDLETICAGAAAYPAWFTVEPVIDDSSCGQGLSRHAALHCVNGPFERLGLDARVWRGREGFIVSHCLDGFAELSPAATATEAMQRLAEFVGGLLGSWGLALKAA